MLGALISWIVVGAIGGWLAGYVMKRDTTFDRNDVILGMLGAIVGGWIVGWFMPVTASRITLSAVFAAFVGAVVLTWLGEWLSRR